MIASTDEVAVQLGQPVQDHDLRSAFDNAPIGMAVVTPHGVITNGNRALSDLLGRGTQDLVGRTFFDVTHPEDLADAEVQCRWMQAGGARVLRHECRFLRPDGHVLWVMVSTSRVPELAGQPAHLIMHVEDISDRKQLEAELSHRAMHDPLTGLANRALLLERLAHALARAERSPAPACLFFLDLDGFKAVNDTHGHRAGDLVLQQLAGRLSGLLRPADTAARVGGDEFAVLCEDTGLDQAGVVAERLRALAAEPFVLEGCTVALTAAVGVSACGSGDTGTGRDEMDGAAPTESTDLRRAAEVMLHQADLQMYQAKRTSTALREGPDQRR